MATVFNDDFESGGLTNWTGSVKGDGNTFSVITPVKAGMGGTYCGDSDYNSMVYKDISALSEIWITFKVLLKSDVNSGWFWLKKVSTSANIFYIRYKDFQLHAYVGGSEVAVGAHVITPSLATKEVKIHFKMADTGGIIEVYYDGVLEINYSGDTKPGADTVFDRVYLGYQEGGAINAWFDDFTSDNAGFPSLITPAGTVTPKDIHVQPEIKKAILISHTVQIWNLVVGNLEVATELNPVVIVPVLAPANLEVATEIGAVKLVPVLAPANLEVSIELRSVFLGVALEPEDLEVATELDAVGLIPVLAVQDMEVRVEIGAAIVAIALAVEDLEVATQMGAPTLTPGLAVEDLEVATALDTILIAIEIIVQKLEVQREMGEPTLSVFEVEDIEVITQITGLRFSGAKNGNSMFLVL